MFNARQFRDLILKPVLHGIDAWSQPAEDILVMTMAHESNGGTYLHQLGNGPACGIYEMEVGTFNDLWIRTLKDPDNKLHALLPKIMVACNLAVEPKAEEMNGNLYLATAMARVYYLRIRAPIPSDLNDMALYAKKYWNTEFGKATPQNYLSAYLKFDPV